MSGRELAEKLNYTGMEINIRKLALEDKMDTPENLAIMSIEQVCELVVEEYQCVFVQSESLGLVKKSELDKYNGLVKYISR